MKTQWVFIDLDKAAVYVEEELPALPTPGDGKFHNGKGYKVSGILTRFTTDIPLIVAEEHA